MPERSTMESLSLSFVIPCYKSASTICNVVSELISKLAINGNTHYEIILVIDGSPDETLVVANSLALKHNQVRVIELARNFGQQASIFAGIAEASFEFIITLDDDGQHPASSIIVLVNAIDDETDVIYGVAHRNRHSLIRNTFSYLFKLLILLFLNVEKARDISALRVIRSSMIRDKAIQDNSYVPLDVALHWRTNRFKTVHVEIYPRANGKSNYNFRSLLRFALLLIVGYSTKPLRFASILGFFGFVTVLTASLYILVKYLLGDVEVLGFAASFLLLGYIGSLLLLAIGIIGEYVALIFQKLSGKPLYVVRSINKHD